MPVKYSIRARFNPNHVPAGSAEGGEFSSANLSVQTPAALNSYMGLLRSYPNYHPNIIGMKVGGKYIFNPNKSLGIARHDMPQVPTAARDDFLSRIPNHSAEVDPRKLYPTQGELDGYKTAKFSLNENDAFRAPIVSRDNYVIDGHHNWASAVVRAQSDPGYKMNARVVDMDRDHLLQAARDYANHHGFESKTISKFNPNHDEKGRFSTSDSALGGDKPVEPHALGKPYYLNRLAVGDDEGTMAGMGKATEIHDSLVDQHFAHRKDLTDAQYQAVSDYQSFDYKAINAYAANMGPNYKPDGKTIAAVQAVDKYVNPFSTGAAVKDLDGALESAPKIPDGTTVYRAFRSQELVDKGASLIGETIRDPRFLSTSIHGEQGAAWVKGGGGRAVLFKLKTEDARGLYLTNSGSDSGQYEHEILFGRNTPVHVTDVRPLMRAIGTDEPEKIGILIEGTIGHRRG